MTATAVLDRTNIAARTASPSPPPPSGDEEYARQLNRRLADDRSSAPRTANTPRADTAPSRPNENRAGVEPTSKNEADPPAVGSPQIPFIANTNAAREEEVPADESNESLHAQGVLSVTPADSAVSSAPPFPWQQNPRGTVEPQVPSDVPKELPSTAKAPASPPGVHHGNGDDASVPEGLIRADEVTTTRSRGVVVPPGLVVAFDAVQQRRANTTAFPTESDAGGDTSSEAGIEATKSPQPVAPTAPSATTTVASAFPTPEPVGAVPVVGIEQPAAATDADSTSDPAALDTSVPNLADHVTLQVHAETASVEATSVKAAPVQTVAASIEAVEPPAVEPPAVEATAQLENSDPATIGTNAESTDHPVADQSQPVANQHRKSLHGSAHAADVVADATTRAVEAITSSPAAPVAVSRATSPTEAIPAALHASLTERAIDITDAPDAPASGTVATTASDSAPIEVRGNAKTVSPSSGQAVGTQPPSESNLADGLPRHAAAALRAAAGFDRPIRIRLSPAELGALQVEVGRHEGSLQARFEVTTPAAQAMLHDHLSALRESLGRAGLTVDRIDVRLVESSPDEGRADSQQQSNSSGEQGSHRGQEHERPRPEQPDSSRREPDSDDTTRPSGDSVAPQAERPKKNALNHAADLLDIQV